MMSQNNQAHLLDNYLQENTIKFHEQNKIFHNQNKEFIINQNPLLEKYQKPKRPYSQQSSTRSERNGENCMIPKKIEEQIKQILNYQGKSEDLQEKISQKEDLYAKFNIKSCKKNMQIPRCYKNNIQISSDKYKDEKINFSNISNKNINLELNSGRSTRTSKVNFGKIPSSNKSNQSIDSQKQYSKKRIYIRSQSPQVSLFRLDDSPYSKPQVFKNPENSQKNQSKNLFFIQKNIQVIQLQQQQLNQSQSCQHSSNKQENERNINFQSKKSENFRQILKKPQQINAGNEKYRQLKLLNNRQQNFIENEKIQERQQMNKRSSSIPKVLRINNFDEVGGQELRHQLSLQGTAKFQQFQDSDWLGEEPLIDYSRNLRDNVWFRVSKNFKKQQQNNQITQQNERKMNKSCQRFIQKIPEQQSINNEYLFTFNDCENDPDEPKKQTFGHNFIQNQDYLDKNNNQQIFQTQQRKFIRKINQNNKNNNNITSLKEVHSQRRQQIQNN